MFARICDVYTLALQHCDVLISLEIIILINRNDNKRCLKLLSMINEFFFLIIQRHFCKHTQNCLHRYVANFKAIKIHVYLFCNQEIKEHL